MVAYGFDTTAGAKREVSRQLIERLDATENGAASVQVLQELFVTLTRKFHPAMPADAARVVISDLTSWQIVEPTARDVLQAIDNTERWHVSFWDAMLLTAANKIGANLLWTEDLNDGHTYGSVTIRNPFA